MIRQIETNWLANSQKDA